MRSTLFRCLVFVVALAFVSGTAARAWSKPMPSMMQIHCQDEAEGGMKDMESPPHPRHHGMACCIDCFGCVAFADLGFDPPLGFMPLSFVSAVNYGDRPGILVSRAVSPDPDPPRPSA